jgi:hypothetical protein
MATPEEQEDHQQQQEDCGDDQGGLDPPWCSDRCIRNRSAKVVTGLRAELVAHLLAPRSIVGLSPSNSIETVCI